MRESNSYTGSAKSIILCVCAIYMTEFKFILEMLLFILFRIAKVVCILITKQSEGSIFIYTMLLTCPYKILCSNHQHLFCVRFLCCFSFLQFSHECKSANLKFLTSFLWPYIYHRKPPFNFHNVVF